MKLTCCCGASIEKVDRLSPNSAIRYSDGTVEVFPKVGNTVGRGKAIICDGVFWDKVKDLPWRVIKRGQRFYAQHRNILMHRMVAASASYPQVDHRNGNGLDNRRQNLRPCTNSQNQMNLHARRGGNPFKGVNWNKRDKAWTAKIVKDFKQIHIGTFKTAEAAAHAYDTKAVELFGEFAAINFTRES